MTSDHEISKQFRVKCGDIVKHQNSDNKDRRHKKSKPIVANVCYRYSEG